MQSSDSRGGDSSYSKVIFFNRFENSEVLTKTIAKNQNTRARGMG